MADAQYRRDVRSDMRAWLLDCFNNEADRQTIELANHAVLMDAIERHYEGGMDQFMVDGDYPGVIRVQPGGGWDPAESYRQMVAGE